MNRTPAVQEIAKKDKKYNNSLTCLELDAIIIVDILHSNLKNALYAHKNFLINKHLHKFRDSLKY
jgi:hypothetical protein